MSPAIFSMAEYYLVLVLSIAALGMEVWALVNCLTHRPDAFVAADKRTKPFWLIITGLCAAVGVLSVSGPGLGFLQILAVLGAGIYLADVKPALESLRGYR